MEKIIHDVETGELSVVELSAKEIQEIKKIQADAEVDRLAAEAEAATKSKAKAALLEKLGISEEEAELLVG
jgi:hypothetical protein